MVPGDQPRIARLAYLYRRVFLEKASHRLGCNVIFGQARVVSRGRHDRAQTVQQDPGFDALVRTPPQQTADLLGEIIVVENVATDVDPLGRCRDCIDKAHEILLATNEVFDGPARCATAREFVEPCFPLVQVHARSAVEFRYRLGLERHEPGGPHGFNGGILGGKKQAKNR